MGVIGDNPPTFIDLGKVVLPFRGDPVTVSFTKQAAQKRAYTGDLSIL
ncbi:MAG: hypothetical protein AAFN09_02085 [Pseudomonadota bacterium]